MSGYFVLQIFSIPFDRLFQALAHGELRIVFQQAARFVDRRQRVRDVARAVRAVRGFDPSDRRIVFRKKLLQVTDQLIERRSLPECRVVDLVYRCGVGRVDGAEVHLDDVVDVGEVAGIFAVAVDVGASWLRNFLTKSGMTAA